MLEELVECYGGVYRTGATFAILVGTGIKNKAVTGTAWKARRGVLALDEFSSFAKSSLFRSDVVDALLPLTETNQTYSRQIGITLKEPYEEVEEDGLYFRMSAQGEIDLKTRFAMVIGSMNDVTKITQQKHMALMSRCCTIRNEPSKQEINTVLDGVDLFEFRPYFPNKEVYVRNADYEEIRRFIDEQPLRIEDIARCVGDCVRCLAVTGKDDYELYYFIVGNRIRLYGWTDFARWQIVNKLA